MCVLWGPASQIILMSSSDNLKELKCFPSDELYQKWEDSSGSTDALPCHCAPFICQVCNQLRQGPPCLYVPSEFNL